MSGKFWKYVHLCGVIFFIGLWIYAGAVGLVKSVVFVSHVSMVALVLAELSAWQAARTEDKEDQKQD
jgi:hypothetical protein